MENTAYLPGLRAFARSVNEFSEDIEFLRSKGVNVDMYWFQNNYYQHQIESLEDVLKQFEKRKAELDDPEVQKCQNDLKDPQLGVDDLHRYMRFKHSEGDRLLPQRLVPIEVNVSSPMCSGYESSTSTPRSKK